MLAAQFALAVGTLVTSPLSKPASIAATAEAAVAAAFTPAMAAALAECNPSMPAHLRSQQVVAVMDNVLGADVCERLRREAEALRTEGYLEDCESSGNVRAIQCEQGDDEMRAVAEGLVSLPLATARAVAQRINDAVELTSSASGTPLIVASGAHTNKLAVVENDGSGYLKHVDNVFGTGGDDVRKATAIYYLNPGWDAEHAGFLRAYDASLVLVSPEDGEPMRTGGDGSDVARIAPRGDRLVVFWSDALVHDVEPSCITCDADHRWALTTWLIAADPEADPSLSQGLDQETWKRHFDDAPAEESAASRLAKSALETGLAGLYGLLRRGS